MITIRHAKVTDLNIINDIYNYFILNSAITFDVEPWSMAKRTAWFNDIQNNKRLNVLVAVSKNKVIGFAYNAPFKPKQAFDSSTELTIYKSADSSLKGVGRALYRHILLSLKPNNYHRAYAWITTPNAPSMRLHRALGFKQTGLMKEVGYKHGKFHDVVLLEKIL